MFTWWYLWPNPARASRNGCVGLVRARFWLGLTVAADRPAEPTQGMKFHAEGDQTALEVGKRYVRPHERRVLFARSDGLVRQFRALLFADKSG